MRKTYPLPGLRRRREDALLTRDQLAAASGVHAMTIKRIEAGANAEVRTIQALAKALKCKPADLMEG